MEKGEVEIKFLGKIWKMPVLWANEEEIRSFNSTLRGEDYLPDELVWNEVVVLRKGAPRRSIVHSFVHWLGYAHPCEADLEVFRKIEGFVEEVKK